MEKQNHNSQSLRQDLMVLAQKKQEWIHDKFEEVLKTKRFEHGIISNRWKELTAIAARKASPMANRVSLADFAYVVSYDPKSKKEPTLFQFGVLSNNLEAVSIEDLGITTEEYVDFIRSEAAVYIKMYNERIEALRKEVDMAGEKEFSARFAAAQKNQAALTPVKAEA